MLQDGNGDTYLTFCCNYNRLCLRVLACMLTDAAPCRMTWSSQSWCRLNLFPNNPACLNTALQYFLCDIWVENTTNLYPCFKQSSPDIPLYQMYPIHMWHTLYSRSSSVLRWAVLSILNALYFLFPCRFDELRAATETCQGAEGGEGQIHW